MEPGNMEQIFFMFTVKWLLGTNISFDSGYNHFYSHMFTQSPEKHNISFAWEGEWWAATRGKRTGLIGLGLCYES